MIGVIVTVVMELLLFFLNRNKDDREMQELFLKFIEKADIEYQRAALQRLESKKQNDDLNGKPFEETA